jgi:hypothetical protein
MTAGLSKVDLAALAVVADCQRQTTESLAKLVPGLVVPRPDPPPQKRVRRFRFTRNDDGSVDIDEDDPEPAPVSEPAPSTTPQQQGAFAGIFGTIEGT